MQEPRARLRLRGGADPRSELALHADVSAVTVGAYRDVVHQQLHHRQAVPGATIGALAFRRCPVPGVVNADDHATVARNRGDPELGVFVGTVLNRVGSRLVGGEHDVGLLVAGGAERLEPAGELPAQPGELTGLGREPQVEGRRGGCSLRAAGSARRGRRR